MAKYALVSMMGNVGGSLLNTQGSGYYNILKKMINNYLPEDEIKYNPPTNTWNDYDTIFICESVNFVEGSFNIPGGIQSLHIEKIKAISNYKGEIKYINKEFDFNAFNKRIKIENANFPIGEKINLFLHDFTGNKKTVIGDSHALSVWRPGYTLDFTPGRTLHGFLNRNTPADLNALHNEVVLYFGNIDVRFHLARQADPAAATIDLANRYVAFAKQLTNCTLVEPLPIEHESRKIPGTGLYKKQPFFGTRLERMELRRLFCEVLYNSGLPIIKWPEEWIDEDGTKMLEILESRQSVHLKPRNYPYINEIIG
jgi:hypothetical protein